MSIPSHCWAFLSVPAVLLPTVVSPGGRAVVPFGGARWRWGHLGGSNSYSTVLMWFQRQLPRIASHACLRQEMCGMMKPKLAECRARVTMAGDLKQDPRAAQMPSCSAWPAQLGKDYSLAGENQVRTTKARRLFRPVYHLLYLVSSHCCSSLSVPFKSALRRRETSYSGLDPV